MLKFCFHFVQVVVFLSFLKVIKGSLGSVTFCVKAFSFSFLDDLKKAQEDNNLDEMKAKLEALNEKAQGLALNSTNKLQQLNKLKQEQKAHKQQETQAMTS